MRPKLLLVVALDARETGLGIVSQAADPAFVRGASEPQRLLVDALDRVDVEGRDPGGLGVIDRRDEVGEEAKRAAAAFRGDDTHVAIVAGGAAHPDAGHDLAIAIDER